MLQHGFLGFDASFMLDFVVTALVAIVPVLLYSLYAVKVQRRYLLHRNLQLLLGIVLLVAVSLFEIDMQWVHGGWRNIVNKNPDAPRLTGEAYAHVESVLRIHLIFAISTPFLWGATLLLAWRRFPSPPHPAKHSRSHKILGWLSVIDIVATSATGLWFYYVAFVATS
jgi:putative membrane protein